jgi:hypothetical protein
MQSLERETPRRHLHVSIQLGSFTLHFGQTKGVVANAFLPIPILNPTSLPFPLLAPTNFLETLVICPSLP